MNKPEFDKFADAYYASHASSVVASGERPEYFSEYKIRDMARELEQYSQEIYLPLKILDFGAGIGGSIPYVRRYFPNAQLTCLDPSSRSLEIAEREFPSQARFVQSDGTHLPFPSEHFDIAYAMCVFHHIDCTEYMLQLQELRRVIRPSGSLFIFEHNPYNPLTVRVVNNCPFDEKAHLIRAGEMKRQLLAAGFRKSKIRYRMFFPHFLRALRPLEMALTWLPLGAQYYVMSEK